MHAACSIAACPAASWRICPTRSPIRTRLHRDMVYEQGAYRAVGNPVKLSRTPAGLHRLPPRFGEANRAVLEGGRLRRRRDRPPHQIRHRRHGAEESGAGLAARLRAGVAPQPRRRHLDGPVATISLPSPFPLIAACRPGRLIGQFEEILMTIARYVIAAALSALLAAPVVAQTTSPSTSTSRPSTTMPGTSGTTARTESQRRPRRHQFGLGGRARQASRHRRGALPGDHRQPALQG